MIGINWFEIFLSAASVEVPVMRVSQSESVRTERTLKFRTILDRREAKLYYVGRLPPAAAELQSLELYAYPALIQHAIDLGFCARLIEAGFVVRLQHVGAIAQRLSAGSVRPAIYEATEGIRFRCFYGFGRRREMRQHRWGLILNYVTGQQFAVSLENEHLARLAVGKRVIPRQQTPPTLDAGHSAPAHGPMSFQKFSNGKAVLLNSDGIEHHVVPSAWTLPCNAANLLAYLRLVGDKEVAEVTSSLQRVALTLTNDGRMNTSLAKDRLEKLQEIMSRYELRVFQLALPGEYPARLNENPLVVGVA